MKKKHSLRPYFIILVAFFPISTWGNIILNVKNYGAKGNGRSDDTQAVQETIKTASRLKDAIVYFPEGVYLLKDYTKTSNFLENYVIRLCSNLTITGEGHKTIIKLGNHLFDKVKRNANAHLFYGYKTHNIEISNLLFEMNGSNNLVPKRGKKNYAAIFTKYGSDYYIHNVVFQNTAGRTMINIMGKGSGLKIDNCRFTNGGPYPGSSMANPFQDDFSFVYSEWNFTSITNCLIKQENIDIALTSYTGGIEIHGSESMVSNNSIIGCWPAIYITSSMDTILHDVTVTNNLIKNCVTGISFWLEEPMEHITLSFNKIQLTPPRNKKLYLMAGILIPNGNAQKYDRTLSNAAHIRDLLIFKNEIFAEQMTTLSAGIIAHSLANSLIMNNIISGMNYGGIVLTGSKWGTDSLFIKGNKFSSFRANKSESTVAAFFIITDTYSPNHPKAPGLRNIFIEDNKLTVNPQMRTGIGKFLGMFVALPESMMKQIIINRNEFTDPDFSVHRVPIR